MQYRSSNNIYLFNEKSKNEKFSNESKYFDRSDTVSIASIQSSIFNFEKSQTSNQHFVRKDKGKHRFKTRPFQFQEKISENWLYCVPKERILEKNVSENPIEWMRTIFDENKDISLSCKSNLKKTLSRSQGNLLLTDNFGLVDENESQLYLNKSISDLKEVVIDSEDSDQIKISQVKLRQTGNAPSSEENVSNLQDCLELAKKQEEKLRAEVLKRKRESHGNGHFRQDQQNFTERQNKNNRNSVPMNHFGFANFNKKQLITSQNKKPNNEAENKSAIPLFKPKVVLQSVQSSNDKLHIYKSENLRPSSTNITNLRLYHV